MTVNLEQVTKKYGNHRAVDDVSFSVPSGQITGFVGANGAGKTTVMHMVMGLLSPSGGKITVDGKPISRSYRAGIGYMPDQQALYPDVPPGEQLLFFARAHGLGTAEAKDTIRRLMGQLGLADRVKEPLSNLSLGNRRRVQLASVLLRPPTALIMDEPFSGLDPQTVDYMEPILREYAAAGIPILFSSHQLDLVERLCDRLVVIGRGRIKAEGSVEELTQGQPGRLVVRYADKTLPDDLRLPPSVTLESHDPVRKRLVVTVEPENQSQAIRQLAHEVELMEVSRQRVPLAESYREIVEQEGKGNEGRNNEAV